MGRTRGAAPQARTVGLGWVGEWSVGEQGIKEGKAEEKCRC